MTSIDNRPLRVFLCHSSNDKPAVRELYQKLRAEPWIQPWLDEEELYPGQDWNMEIEKAVEAADAIIVCLTRNSINKEGYLQRELRIVLDFADYKPEGTLYIIPVRLEDCELPRSLRKWQYADYFEGQRERVFQRLLVSLRRRFDSLSLKIEHPLPDEKRPLIETFLLKEEKTVIEKKPIVGIEKPMFSVANSDQPALMRGEDEEKNLSVANSDLPVWRRNEDEEQKGPEFTSPKEEAFQPTVNKPSSVPTQPIVTTQLESRAELLNQAKGELDRGDIPAALNHYGKLIKRGEYLEETIRDLSKILYRYPVEVGIWQTLGDAYMRANRLKEALEAYNNAEELQR